MSDHFTRDRFRWWDTLAADPEMPPGAFLVGYAIATSLKRNSGTRALVSAANDPDDVVCEAWIGAGEIANRISMSTGTVFSMMRKLEEHGYIFVDKGKAGSGHAHHYRLVEKVSGLTNNSQRADHSKDHRADHSEKPNGQRADHSSPKKVSGLTIKGQPADMNPLLPLKETIEDREDSSRLDVGKEVGRRSRMNPDADTENDANFEDWYRQYPKKVAKAAALKAYRAVITKKLATPEELLAGAMRYAAERSGQDPKYTKHPSTWLQGGCWADEPAKPIGATIDSHGNEIKPVDQRRAAAATSWTAIATGRVQP
jgi:hypothetical protein